MNNKVVKRLIELRKLKGLSQYDIANALKISQNKYARMESGKSHLTLDFLETLANFHNVNITDFFQSDKITITISVSGNTKDKLLQILSSNSDIIIK